VQVLRCLKLEINLAKKYYFRRTYFLPVRFYPLCSLQSEPK